MQSKAFRNIVIVGGGTAGWMAATALATILKGRYAIRLIESDDIGTVGVGEATIPMIQRFNKIIGIDEADFIRATQGTFKLGIEFVNWGRIGDRYMHGFGQIGQDLWTVPFDQYWRKMYALGRAQPLESYSITRAAAKAGKFMTPRTDVGNSPLAEIAYAYHFDAHLYAKYLRKIAETRGVERIEGKITKVHQFPVEGTITGVDLENGQRVDGDFFLDCTGFRGLLIEETLKTGFEDWSHWLPCDRAFAVPCEGTKPLLPYTRATAHHAGWQWRIPLQHRIGNGLVYCSQHLSDDQAATTLLSNLDGRPLAEPRPIRFKTGMRKLGWNKNVVAIGLASGFLEPLESTSIHLIQAALQLLIDFFPDKDLRKSDIDEYNRQNRFQYERIRDFIIMHYHLNQRTDSPFWMDCANMSIPSSLTEKIDLYRSSGKVVRFNGELFSEVGWLQVMEGQNLSSGAYHPLADLIEENETARYLEDVRTTILECVKIMPTHESFIADHCASMQT